jgi:membrane-associated phospholipid phosphatase
MPETSPHVNARGLAIALAWCAVFAVALTLDRPVGRWVVDSGLGPTLKSKDWKWLTRAGWLPGVGRLPGSFLTFTIPASAILVLRGKKFWRPAAFVFLGGAFSGVNQVLKWIVGRPRPFHEDVFTIHPFAAGWESLFHEANLSFPSGDVCLAVATAACLDFLFPRWRAVWLTLVVIVSLERVAAGSHYPSDVVAGAALGWAMALLARRIVQPNRIPCVQSAGNGVPT